mmetsp:Transcript_10205/g.17776  ORF Transcript_10205/g.17776 Transcript_10205/m.17776 type:complete len:148 (+) Transcript_10205:75-518(+)
MHDSKSASGPRLSTPDLGPADLQLLTQATQASPERQGYWQRSKGRAQPAEVEAKGVYVDAIRGAHASTSANLLLDQRRLVWRKDYGWTYDAWVDDPWAYAQSGGANSRFSLPAILRGFGKTANQAAQTILQGAQDLQLAVGAAGKVS